MTWYEFIGQNEVHFSKNGRNDKLKFLSVPKLTYLLRDHSIRVYEHVNWSRNYWMFPHREKSSYDNSLWVLSLRSYFNNVYSSIYGSDIKEELNAR